jgi:hypothetical protein
MNSLKPSCSDIKPLYMAHPLCVFSGDKFIETTDVNDITQGALIELHFKLNHYCICAEKKDSFNGIMQQILVLKPRKP